MVTKREYNTPYSVIVLLAGFKTASHSINFDIVVHTRDLASAKKSLHHIIDNIKEEDVRKLH